VGRSFVSFSGQTGLRAARGVPSSAGGVCISNIEGIAARQFHCLRPDLPPPGLGTAFATFSAVMPNPSILQLRLNHATDTHCAVGRTPALHVVLWVMIASFAFVASAQAESVSTSIPTAASFAALDLFDSTPRKVAVMFEVSPREVPGQVNVQFSREFVATLEPGLRPSEVRVVIPAQTVEEHLLGAQKPIPNSFSDFVWTFDVETGHVISAAMNGRVTPELDWGFMTSHTEVDIEIEMGTARIGGFRAPRHVLGQLIFSYCTDAEDEDCRVVETLPFDRTTGYVNAVGRVWVHSSFKDVFNFSPMGEAIFREVVVPAHAAAKAVVAIDLSDSPGPSSLPAVSTSVSADFGVLQ
jgi:hypothetical protein